jgi:hypothetical protein
MRRILTLAALFAVTGLFRRPTGGGAGPTPGRPVGGGSFGPVTSLTGAVSSISTHIAGTRAGGSSIDSLGRSDPDLDAFRDPGPPPEGADSVLPNGSAIYHGSTFTQIGSDAATTNNAANVAPLPGHHDVVVHGSPNGNLIVDGNEVNPSQIAEAVTGNPNYNGGPIRMVVCHSGASGAGQQVADALGVEVTAPTDRVGTDRYLGPNQTPQIANGGEWITFTPAK